jgi:plastocyanin
MVINWQAMSVRYPARSRLLGAGVTLLIAATAYGQAPGTAAKAAPKAATKADAPAVPSGPDVAVLGRVSFKGLAPVLKPIAMDSEPTCVAKHTGKVYPETVVVNPNGTLKNVFVYVKAGLEGKTFQPPQNAVTLNQSGCMYDPHVFGILVGQDLKIVNSDATTHNVHVVAQINPDFNIGQRQGAGPIIRIFDKPETTVPIVCNQHPWMKAVAHVVSNPYFAVSGNDGGFEIKNLPPGTYTLEALHEKYGASTQQVTVVAGKPVTVNFSFSSGQTYVPGSLKTLATLVVP